MNTLYFKKMTKKATKDYCKEMLKFSATPYQKVNEDEFYTNLDAYLDKIFEYDQVKGELKKHLGELRLMTPFPDDILGYIHEYTGNGIFQPKHLMCKLATLRDDAHKITYEFLFEYNIVDSITEIYYGIKAISDNSETTPEFEEYVEQQGSDWLDRLKALDKSRGKNANYFKRHKLTNNVHDGTFWLSWVRLGSYETLETALKDLENKTLKEFLKFEKVRSETLVMNRIKGIYERLAYKAEVPEFDEELKSTIRRALSKFRVGGNPLVVELKNGLFQFECTNQQAMIFVEYIFNPKVFEEAYQKRSDWKEAQKYWKNTDKQDIKRALVTRLFRARGNKPLSEKFCQGNNRLTFHIEDIKRIAEIYNPQD